MRQTYTGNLGRSSGRQKHLLTGWLVIAARRCHLTGVLDFANVMQSNADQDELFIDAYFVCLEREQNLIRSLADKIYVLK